MLGQHGDLLLRRLVKYQQVALLGADGELGRHLAPLQKGGIAQVGLELLNLPGGQLPDWNLAILVLEDGKGFSVLVPFDFKRRVRATAEEVGLIIYSSCKSGDVVLLSPKESGWRSTYVK